MKKIIFMSGLFVLVFPLIQAQAIYMDGWERPIYTSLMDVEYGTYEYENAKDVRVSLTKKDGAQNFTGLVFQYVSDKTNKLIKIELKLDSINMNNCGSIFYEASSSPILNSPIKLPIIGDLFNEELGNLNKEKDERIFIQLVDHSQDICHNNYSHQWALNVKNELVWNEKNWNGAYDSELRAIGHPEAVFTIMKK